MGKLQNFPKKIKPYRLIGFFGFRAIFIATELLTIIAGLSITKFSISETIFLIFALISTALNLILLGAFEMERAREKNL